jgi:aldehyde dehydrogenase (NAD+)
MRTYNKFCINGQWVNPIGHETSDIINPATGEISARVPMANASDVNAAVAAAKEAFEAWS